METVIYLTDECNMKCKYCYFENKQTNMLSEEILYKILNQIFEMNEEDFIDIAFLGGEPLINKDIFIKAIRWLKDKNDSRINISITTNGTIYDDELLETFKENKIELSISVDGDEETHNLNRVSKNGTNLYRKTIKTIKSLLEEKIDFKIRMTIALNTIERLFDNVLYFYNMGIDKFEIAFNEFEIWDIESLKILDEQVNKLGDWYIDKVDTNIYVNIFDCKIGEFVVERQAMFCSAGTSQHIVFNAKGDIYPCNYVVNEEYWKIGDVFSEFDESVFWSKVRENIEKKKSCEKCKLENYCIGAKCGFKNYKITGKLNVCDKNICNLENHLYVIERRVIKELYKKRKSRLMRYINYAKENNYVIQDLLANEDEEY